MSTVQAGAEMSLNRRNFVQLLGAGLLIAVSEPSTEAQSRARRGGFGGAGARTIAARLHIGKDGIITVMAGKVEAGQGARAEITQAAAEELRVAADKVRLIMADTGLVPDDGITAGSGTTPRTIPAVRHGCAAARELLVALACKQWGVARETVQVHDGKIVHPETPREISYADLVGQADATKSFDQPVSSDVSVTAVKEWKVMGKPLARPNRHDLVTGKHQYPSDIILPGMVYGKVLRPPSYGAKLKSIDVSAAQAMSGIAVIRDGDFIGVTAPTRFAAEQALAAIAKTASWEPAPHPASAELFEHLRKHARGGMPANPFADDLTKSAKSLRQSYEVAYIQHAPLEPRAAAAQWEGDKVTVWTGTQNPFGVRSEVAGALGVPVDHVRVIASDFGAGFGGKHSGEAAVEAARLARAAGKPVSLRWTRQEEFTWAYFRPAGVIDIEAGLDADGTITSWHFVNINSGPSSMQTPYRIAKARSQVVQSEPPLRQGSYRALAATANTFARESALDELADMAGRDPLEFRLAHLEDPRLRAVLETAANRFDWPNRVKRKEPGVGLACGTEKGSFVATCAEVSVDRQQGKIAVRRVCQVFDCGAVVNPDNLTSQMQGAIVMGLGGALREEMTFSDGKITNPSFWSYPVPRFADLPELDIHLLDRPDVPSAGAGETPIIGIAPAVANAVCHASGLRIRQMPIRLPQTTAGHARG